MTLVDSMCKARFALSSIAGPRAISPPPRPRHSFAEKLAGHGYVGRPTVDYRRSCAGSGPADLPRSAADRQGIGISSANTGESRHDASAHRDDLEDRRKPTIELDQEQAIAVRKMEATAHLSLQYNKLTSKGGVLCLKSALRLE